MLFYFWGLSFDDWSLDGNYYLSVLAVILLEMVTLRFSTIATFMTRGSIAFIVSLEYYSEQSVFCCLHRVPFWDVTLETPCVHAIFGFIIKHAILGSMLNLKMSLRFLVKASFEIWWPFFFILFIYMFEIYLLMWYWSIFHLHAGDAIVASSTFELFII